MAKRQTNEKSASPTRSPEAAGERPGQKMVLAAYVVIAGGLILFFIALPFAAGQPKPKNEFQKPFTRRNFGFMQQTARWLNQLLVLSAIDETFDLSSKIPNWRGRQVFAYASAPGSPKASFAPLRTKLEDWRGIPNPWSAFKNGEQIIGFDLNEEMIYALMSGELAQKIDRAPKDAALKIENGRAREFDPGMVGRHVDSVENITAIKRALFTKKSVANLAMVTLNPAVTLPQTNDLGIRELVAVGESDFHGSSASRMQNIRVGAAKFDGVILKPGEEFSFNHYLGPVTVETGFKPELVIKSTGTVPELGGGLCQVSTTSFRAAFYGGLAITARKNHSYAVKYYSPQGTDATIYPGAVDFKFINDTSAYLLIHTRIEGAKLYFEYYGTKDDRVVVIDGPYQYDKRSDGSMKARLARAVTKNGQTNSDNFFSTYVSKDRFPTVYEFPKPITPETSPPQSQTENPKPSTNDSGFVPASPSNN